MQSHNLRLPYISSTQASPSITHNEALRALDALVQPVVQTVTLASPPATPPDGANYVVAAAATGAWTGHSGDIAAWQDGAWMFLEPREGWQIWVLDEARARLFDGADWIVAPMTASRLGVNMASDGTNRLAVASPATLLTHVGDDHRVKVNKASAGNTASFLFQSGWSGRAEIGLAGDDDLRFKVSSDGAAWNTGLSVRASDGKVRLPQGLVDPLSIPNGGTGAVTGLGALSSLGLRHASSTIADDTVATFNFGTPVYGSVIFLVGNTNAIPLGTVFARMAPSPQLFPIGVSGGTLGSFTTDLTGTTGPDNQVNMAALDNGIFKIENRRGYAISYTLYLLR